MISTAGYWTQNYFNTEATMATSPIAENRVTIILWGNGIFYLPDA
jgi:hypothetical protein